MTVTSTGQCFRVDTTDIDLVYDLMINHWQMHQPKEPNLIITVIGGAKNFRLDGKKKEIFNRGLIEVRCCSELLI